MDEKEWESWKWIQGNLRLSGIECSDEALRKTAEHYESKGLDAVPLALDRIAAKTGRDFIEIGRKFLPIIDKETEAGSTFPEVLKKHYPEVFDEMFGEENSKDE